MNKETHRQLKPGDHIYVDFGAFIHHGIYCGDNKVIHYKNGKVRRDSIERFSYNKNIRVKKYYKCSSSEKVIERANRRLGERKYHLVFNNCEHFATWCKTRRHRSKQVEDLAGSVIKFTYYHSKPIVKETQKNNKNLYKTIKKTKVRLPF
jgi:hypothetical protein